MFFLPSLQQIIHLTNDLLIVQLTAGIEITSASSKLELYAKENLLLQQGDTKMTMDGKMRVSGARLNLN